MQRGEERGWLGTPFASAAFFLLSCCAWVLLWMNLGAGSGTDSSPATSRLSLSPPHNLFVQGEWMTLKCSVPDRYRPHVFFFRCKNKSGSSILEKTHQRNTWNISTAHLNETRKLICSCWSKSRTGTQWSYSTHSNSIELLVVDIPPPPLLNLDPLSQRAKEPGCLFLLCSAEGSIAKKKFHFYKDGVEITSSQECLPKSSSEPADLLHSGSLGILRDHSTHNREFACGYEEKRSNRWIVSSWSQRLNVPAWTEDSDLVGRYAWMVILLIILLVPFAFYCWKKKNRLEAKEHKEEKADHGMSGHQAARAPVKEPEVIYSLCRVSSSLSSPGPVMEVHLPPEEEGTVLYSDLLFPQTARKHTAR